MTKPRMEREAYDHLVRQSFCAYLPQWLDLKKQRGVWRRVQLPMFPRYLFIRPSYPEQAMTPVRSTRGVSQLVHFGNETAMASEALISDIRRVEAVRSEMRQVLTPFKKGDLVQVTEGFFRGVSAEVLSCDEQRVILLLQVLGKTQRLEFQTNVCQAH